MKEKVFLILTLILVLLLLINFYLFKKSENNNTIYIPSFGEISKVNESKNESIIKIEYACENDEECILASTNCCPENAGAHWECINKNSTILCNPEGVLCPQVISPMPNIKCRCINNRCSE